ncbi:M1 family metallopeptidase [Nocardioides mangrovi]|uniref:Aminopeptidase N n=1 Tax=Nocardioides mangrovi TaxID=2874580 RepID=A0ABS7UAU9_9ACTN|nr:M1 family metallopeptidase [Nocardioides mangrovi]MBZ5738116.1 M1 family metallopeptidase [Nocardioides mangrovi]
MRTLSALIATTLLTAVALPAAAAPSYDGGLSTPREDSYYPQHGDPGVDVLHYGLDLRWHRGSRTLVGSADITLRATADADDLQLDLGRTLHVREVSVDGTRVASSHDGAVLHVEQPVVSDQRYLVHVGYRGTPHTVAAPSTRSDQRGGLGMRVTKDGQLRTMQEPYGAFTWYPANDQPSDKALLDVRVTAPKGWVGVSNGRLLSRKRTAAGTVTRFHLAHPVATYLTTLAVGPYVHRTATGPHGLPLSYWLPRSDPERYLKVLRHLPADLRWLEDRLGRYPFESAGVVVVPGASAMETQTLVTFGAKTWAASEIPREILVHEVAHQWYGDTVTPSDWSDLWMNEGMAMYLEARWSASHGRAPWSAWTNYFSQRNRRDRAEQGGPGDYDPGMFASGCVYYCTSAMYEKLRGKIGNDAFWQLVQQWPQSQPDANVDRAGFAAMAEELSGQDLGDFFETWLTSPTWPPA